MKHLALGWACNLNDIFVRFPYEKCKSLMRDFKTKILRRQKVKQVFREGVQQVLEDIEAAKEMLHDHEMQEFAKEELEQLLSSKKPQNI